MFLGDNLRCDPTLPLSAKGVAYETKDIYGLLWYSSMVSVDIMPYQLDAVLSEIIVFSHTVSPFVTIPTVVPTAVLSLMEI